MSKRISAAGLLQCISLLFALRHAQRRLSRISAMEPQHRAFRVGSSKIPGWCHSYFGCSIHTLHGVAFSFSHRPSQHQECAGGPIRTRTAAGRSEEWPSIMPLIPTLLGCIAFFCRWTRTATRYSCNTTIRSDS